LQEQKANNEARIIQLNKLALLVLLLVQSVDADVNAVVKDSSYFFCSTGHIGTEGIRPVENSVPFFVAYRAILCTPIPKSLKVKKL